MVKTVNTYLHNKFVFEVRDAATNELKQEATAYNIVLDNMYERLCTRSSFFTYIQVGTGNGELDAERKTLFTWGIGKSATTHETEVDYPTSYVTKRIILNPEDLVGETLTEVGIGYASQGSLVTHAKLQDAAGAPLTINKTSLDVVIVYATVYFTFSLPAGVALSNLYNEPATISPNALIRYLLGGAWSGSVSVYCGAAAAPVTEKMLPTDGYSVSLGSALSSAVSSDVDNKKLILSTVRAATINFNYSIKELIFSKLFSISIPNTEYAGTQYNNVPIATGDGESTEFTLPSYNIRESSLAIRVAGINTVTTITTAQLLTQCATQAYADAHYVPYGLGYFTVNNDYYYILGRYVGSDIYTYIYKEILKGTTLATTYMENSYSWEKASYTAYTTKICGLAVRTPDASSVNLYQLNYNGFNLIEVRDIITDQPSASTYHRDISADKKILIVMINHGDYYLKQYRYDTDLNAYVLAKLLFSATAQAYQSKACLSETGKWLAYFDTNIPALQILERIGDEYGEPMTIIGLPAFSSAALNYNDRNNLLFSPDEKLLFFKPDESDIPLYVLKFDDITETWIAQDIPNMLSRGSYAVMKFSIAPDSQSFIVYNRSTLDWRLYKLNAAGNFIQENYVPHSGNTNVVCLSRILSKNNFLSFISRDEPGYVQDINNWQTTITFDEPPEDGAPITADYFVEGIHKTDQYVLDVGLEIQFGELT